MGHFPKEIRDRLEALRKQNQVVRFNGFKKAQKRRTKDELATDLSRVLTLLDDFEAAKDNARSSYEALKEQMRRDRQWQLQKEQDLQEQITFLEAEAGRWHMFGVTAAATIVNDSEVLVRSGGRRTMFMGSVAKAKAACEDTLSAAKDAAVASQCEESG